MPCTPTAALIIECWPSADAANGGLCGCASTGALDITTPCARYAIPKSCSGRQTMKAYSRSISTATDGNENLAAPCDLASQSQCGPGMVRWTNAHGFPR